MESDQNLVALVILAEFLGRAVFLFLEDAVEIADVVEAAFVAYLSYGGRAVDEHARCRADADVDYVV